MQTKNAPYDLYDIMGELPPLAKNGLIDESYRWTDAKIIYEFDPVYSKWAFLNVYKPSANNG